MKPTKSTIIPAFCLVFCGLTMLSLVTVDLYTKEQLVYLLERGHQYNKSTYSLGDFLYFNAHTHIDGKITKKGESPYGSRYEQKWPDGKPRFPVGFDTPDFYKTGWRTYVANNPEMAYITLKKYKIFIIDTHKQLLMKKLKNQKSVDSVLTKQKEILNKYKMLINNLLKLNDSNLQNLIGDFGNGYMDSWGYQGNAPIKLYEWLLKEGHIAEMPLSNNYANEYIEGIQQFPMDILLLTYRVNRDYPQWSFRKFLKEAEKFINEFDKVV